MNLTDLLNELAERGLNVRRNDRGNPEVVGPLSHLTPALKAALKTHREHFVDVRRLRPTADISQLESANGNNPKRARDGTDKTDKSRSNGQSVDPLVSPDAVSDISLNIRNETADPGNVAPFTSIKGGDADSPEDEFVLGDRDANNSVEDIWLSF